MPPIHDYVIDNSTGANVRADINNVLQAILTNNSSSSAPTTTAAYMWWADITTGTLKIRNSANNGWVELLQLDGTLTLEDGSASTPGLAFRDDLDTGIFSGGANEFNISTGGTERFVIDSSGLVGIGTTSPSNALDVQAGTSNTAIVARSTDAKAQISLVDNSTTSVGSVVVGAEGDALFLTSGSGGTEAMRINSSGNVGIGTASPAMKLDVENTSACIIQAKSTDNNTSTVLQLIGKNSSGTSRTAKMAYDNADEFRLITSDAIPITFATSGPERMRIDSAGKVHIGLTNGSGQFNIRNQNDSSTNAFEVYNDNGVRNASFSQSSTGDGTMDLLTNASSQTVLLRSNGDSHLSGGSVGIGVSNPSSFNADGRNLVVGSGSGGQGLSIYSANNNYGNIYFADGTSDGSYNAGGILYNHSTNSMRFDTAAGERMRIDSSGRLLVNTSTTGNIATKIVSLVTAGTSASWAQCGLAITHASAINRKALIGFGFSGNGGTNPPTAIGSISTNVSNFENAALVFYTRSATSDTEPSERVRINSAGHFLFSCTNSDDSTETGIKLFENDSIPYITNTINSSSANHSFYHLYNKNASNNGYRFYVKQDGGIGNHSGNNVNLSDEREKKNITLMGSVYDTFKQFVFKDFNYISEADSVTKKHGLIAQDVESIDSDLIADDFKTSVDSEGNDILRKALKEEQFMMIGFKALQEAIAKIEVLETEVAALKAA